MFFNKTLSCVVIASIFLSFTPIVNAGESDNYFVVTAYYSPLPDQEYYITGDYQKELRLNGQWIAWASGKWVFSGMLAAPGKYTFGTKVYLDGLGIGSVEDRGGAIVPAGQRWYSYDRIDVWMGYGDEGLRRANFWWKRTVYGYVVDSWNQTTINYKNVPAPGWAVTGLKKAGTTTSISTPIKVNYVETPVLSVFDVSLSSASDSKSITEMQSIFDELGYMSRAHEVWVYDEATIDNIVDFQLKHGLITDAYEVWAWSFGPKTRAKLKELYDAQLKELAEKELFLEEIKSIQKSNKEKAENHINTLGVPKYGDITPNVRGLQKTLNSLWYFEYKDTAIFWVKTRNSLIEYQLERNIISTNTELGAWVFGPKTREQITKDISEFYFENELIGKELLEKYTNYVEKESIEEEQEQISQEIEAVVNLI